MNPSTLYRLRTQFALIGNPALPLATQAVNDALVEGRADAADFSADVVLPVSVLDGVGMPSNPEPERLWRAASLLHSRGRTASAMAEATALLWG